jgi:hypothetical protein
MKASVFQVILSCYSKEYKTYLETFCRWRSLVYDLQYDLGLQPRKGKRADCKQILFLLLTPASHAKCYVKICHNLRCPIKGNYIMLSTVKPHHWNLFVT